QPARPGGLLGPFQGVPGVVAEVKQQPARAAPGLDLIEQSGCLLVVREPERVAEETRDGVVIRLFGLRRTPTGSVPETVAGGRADVALPLQPLRRVVRRDRDPSTIESGRRVAEQERAVTPRTEEPALDE